MEAPHVGAITARMVFLAPEWNLRFFGLAVKILASTGKNTMRLCFASILISTASAASAQAVPDEIYSLQQVHYRFAMAPALGQESTATAGSPIFERQRSAYTRLTQPTEKASWKGGSVETWKKLVTESERPQLRACRYDYRGKSCVIDSDLDGRFDLGEVTEYGEITGGPLKQPVGYLQVVDNPIADPRGEFRQQLTYLGVAAGTLRLSYREFVNDMARPAFTDEVTFTLSGKYPETVAYKDLVIDVLGVGNVGIRYVIRKVAAAN